MVTANEPGAGDLRVVAKGEYVPGVCNIGPAEIERRRRGAIAATAITGVLYLVLVVAGAARPFRLAIAVPAAGAAVSWLQVVLRFCVAFGARGLYNFGALSEERDVVQREAHQADLRRTRAMVGGGLGIGVLVGILAALIP